LGGSAAAVATTITAVTGAGLPAAASIVGTAPTSTADHVRRVLDQVNVELGLVDPARLQRQIERSYADYVSSAPRDPDASDLDAWVRQRMAQLCGTESYLAAVSEIPQTRLLLAFSLLAYSHHQDTALPPLSQSMGVPLVLRTLESDFLPVLLRQLNERCLASHGYALALQATSAELDRIFAEMLQSSSGGMVVAQAQPGSPADTAGYIAGVFVILGFLYWIKGGLKNR
jgi:hypothetical protein